MLEFVFDEPYIQKKGETVQSPENPYTKIAIDLAVKNTSKENIISSLIGKGCLSKVAIEITEQIRRKIRRIVRVEALKDLIWSSLIFIIAVFVHSWEETSPQMQHNLLGLGFTFLVNVFGLVCFLISAFFIVSGRVPAKYNIFGFRRRVIKKTENLT
jgi:hypothetical protein